MSRCGVAAVMPSPYSSATSRPSCSTTSASVYVPSNISAAVALLPSSRQTGGSGNGPSAAASGDPPPGPAGIAWLGMISRMCRKAHRLNGGSCQLASVTRAFSAGGKPAMSSAAAVLSLVISRTLTDRLHQPASSRIWLMSQEPAPEGQGAPVTALNWQEPPGNRWAFWHVADILPTHLVSRGTGPVRPLPLSEADADLLAVPVARAGQPSVTVGEVLDDTYTDAYLVLQDGKLV